MKYLFTIFLFSCFLIACENALETPKIKDASRNALKAKIKKEEVPSSTLPFVSKKGKFSILFPAPPNEHQHTTTSEIGEIELTQYIYDKDGTQAWVASYSDYPEKMIRLSNKEQLLKGIKYRVLDDLRARTISEQKVKLNNKFNGLSFVAHAKKKDLNILYKMFLVDNRVYQLSMYSSIGSFSAKDSTDFFGSFKLLETTAPPS